MQVRRRPLLLAMFLPISLVPVFAVHASAQVQSDPQIEAAKSQLEEGLKDPGSVQYRRITVAKNTLGETAVCGEFNARNSFGGYEGFRTFGVAGNHVSFDPEELERMGCMGADVERARRRSDADRALINQLNDNAEYSCQVVWTMMDNYFRQKQSKEDAVDAALLATKNRAHEHNRDIAPDVLQAIRTQFETNLEKTALDKRSVQFIKRGDETFKETFLKSCTLQTEQTLRVRAGIKP